MTVRKGFRYSDAFREHVAKYNMYPFTKESEDFNYVVSLARRMETLGFHVLIEQASPGVGIYRLFVGRKAVGGNPRGKFGAPKKRVAKKKPTKKPKCIGTCHRKRGK